MAGGKYLKIILELTFEKPAVFLKSQIMISSFRNFYGSVAEIKISGIQTMNVYDFILILYHNTTN